MSIRSFKTCRQARQAILLGLPPSSFQNKFNLLIGKYLRWKREKKRNNITFMFNIPTTKRWTKIYRTLLTFILCKHFVYTENRRNRCFYQNLPYNKCPRQIAVCPLAAQWPQSILINATPGVHKFPVHFAD